MAYYDWHHSPVTPLVHVQFFFLRCLSRSYTCWLRWQFNGRMVDLQKQSILTKRRLRSLISFIAFKIFVYNFWQMGFRTYQNEAPILNMWIVFAMTSPQLPKMNDIWVVGPILGSSTGRGLNQIDYDVDYGPLKFVAYYIYNSSKTPALPTHVSSPALFCLRVNSAVPLFFSCCPFSLSTVWPVQTARANCLSS